MLEHIDFVAVRMGEKVTVDVPLHLVGDAVSETLVVTENSSVQVEAEATSIPDYIDVSIQGATVGTQIHASDLVLPEGTYLLTDPETLMVNVTQAQTAEQLEAELAEAEADAGIVHEAPARRPPRPRPPQREHRGRGRRARRAEGDAGE